ncbi:hypothetical protein BBK82_36890 [Lentzea guizhouensis]|uniref:Methyltransferase type 11 domain-containing protein n=1 Tax=Lentzea guizhouensis TaxID=1586287 RepID=A0A1B2HSM7_9PSEU|nr:class I SAM-dependent methyltransferase [Lentzea guizhouensis]ANZ40746.1 hypothetical protein BBK82_36890 [Lentzea guizhouensis]
MELDLREGDMRELSLDEPAALVHCPFRSLLHLTTWADRRRTFDRVAAALRPGGRFALNAFAFDHRVAARIFGVHQDAHAMSSLWWASKNEWLGLIDVAGLELPLTPSGACGGWRR